MHAQAAAGVAPHQGLGGKGGNILPRDLPQETPGEIAKVRAMLAVIDPDLRPGEVAAGRLGGAIDRLGMAPSS